MAKDKAKTPSTPAQPGEMDDSKQPGSGESAPASPSALVLKERTELREAIASIRDRADKSAKLIGAVAVALAGYLGITALDEIFPLHVARPGGLMILLWAVSVVLLVGGIGAWIGRLQRVGAPISLRLQTPSDDGDRSGTETDRTAANDRDRPGITNGVPAAKDPNDFNAAERRLIARVFDDHAAVNGYPTIEELAGAVRAKAEGAQPFDPAAKPAGDPAVLSAELQVVLVRAAADVVRSRYRDAFASPGARLAMGIAVTGYVGLALTGAWLDGRSQGQVDRAKDCAALVKSQLDAKLTPTELKACDGLVPGVAGAADRAAGTSPSK